MKLTKMAAILTIGAAGALAESPVRQIVVSIPDRKLVLLEDGNVKKIYDIAVGKTATPSPTGSFHIASRVKNPTWYGPGIVAPPGKGNPLGTRWMGLGFKGYGIHGTNAPRSIGKAASHGCIRMRTSDAEDLFTRVDVGDEVQLVGERNEQIAKLLPATPAPDPAPPAVTATPAAMDTTGGLQ